MKLDDEPDRSHDRIRLKVRKRTSKDQRYSDLGDRVLTVEFLCQSPRLLACLLNALASETKDYRDRGCRDMIVALHELLAPLKIRGLDLYLAAAMKAVAVYDGKA